MPPAFAAPLTFRLHPFPRRSLCRHPSTTPTCTRRAPRARHRAASPAVPPRARHHAASPAVPPRAAPVPDNTGSPHAVPPPGLGLLVHDVRLVITFVRGLLTRPPARPRSATAARLSAAYASARGAAQRMAERAALRAERVTERWHVLRAFAWQFAPPEQAEQRRRIWLQKVQRFVHDSDRRPLAAVCRAAVTLVGGVFGAAEQVVSRIATSGHVTKAFQAARTRVVGRVLAAEKEPEVGALRGKLNDTMDDTAVATRLHDAVRKAPVVSRAPVHSGMGVAPLLASSQEASSVAVAAACEEGSGEAALGRAAVVAAVGATKTGRAARRWEESDMVRGCAGVLLGCAAAGAAGMSVGGVLTVSAVAVAAVGVTVGSEQRRKVGRAEARGIFQRSRIGRGVARAARGGGVVGGGERRRRTSVGTEVRAGRKEKGRLREGVFEVGAYQIGEGVPAIMGKPVVGTVVTWLDDVLFAMEGVLGRVGRRMGLRREGKVEGWTMLAAFEKSAGVRRGE